MLQRTLLIAFSICKAFTVSSEPAFLSINRRALDSVFGIWLIAPHPTFVAEAGMHTLE